MAFHNLRFAARTLWGKNRSAAWVSVLTLAIGIGATTAIFSVLKGVVLEPLPYPEPDRLVQVFNQYYNTDGEYLGEAPFNTGPDFLDMRDRLDSFASVAALYTYSPEGFNLTEAGRAQRISRLKVSAGYFDALGVHPILGRGFRDEENLLEGEIDPERLASYAPARRLAVLSYGLWQRQFNGAQDVLGKDIRLDGEPYTILGVMPAGYLDPLVGEVDVLVPHNLSVGGYNGRHNNYLAVLGRLKKSVAPEAAIQEMQALDASLAEEFDANRGRRHTVHPLKSQIVGNLDQTLWLLTAAVATLLLVACVNVANLLLARGASRSRELAVRSALGCSRLVLFRQLLTESVLLAAAGGIAGLVVAAAGVPLLLSLRPENLPLVSRVGFDVPVFLFCALAALGTGLLFGLAPSVRAFRTDLEQALRDGSRDGSQAAGSRTRGILVAAQVALALVLVTAAGLLSKSFLGMLDIDLGFQPRGAVEYRVELPLSRYGDPARRVAFYEDLHRRLETSPGIRAAGSISHPPVSGPFHGWGFREEGSDPNQPGSNHSAQIRVVDGHCFEALSVGLFRGRQFESGDRAGSPPVILVNRALANEYFKDQEVVGKRLLVGGGDPRTVVGIVADVRTYHLQPAPPKIYIPHTQFADDRNWKLYQFVTGGASTEGKMAQVRRVVGQLDPELAVFGAKEMEEVAAAGISQQRFATVLMGVFSACTLFLAAVGLFGVLSHSVQMRKREIAIRMAVGAAHRHIRHLVLRQAAWLVGGGILAGAAAGLAVTRWMQSMLHDVDATDPLVFASVGLFLAAVALCVAYFPARRAARLDPMNVLHED